PTNPAMMLDVDELIKKHELLERDLRARTDDDETAAITALADEIGRCAEFGEIPAMLARALGGGLSLEGAGEALSVGGSTLFLRSKTGNPMDVHINTGANTRRYLLRQAELLRRLTQHQAAGALDLDPGARGPYGPTHAGDGRPARARAGRRASFPHAGRAARGDREAHQPPSGGRAAVHRR